MEQARRYNKGKLRYELLPENALKDIVEVYTKGAEKYSIYDDKGNLIEDGANNWRKGLPWMSTLGSVERHIRAYKQCEDIDEDLGTKHLANAAWGLLTLLEYYKIAPQYDDRIKKRQLKIGLDIDEVLCDWLGGWMEMKGIKERPTSWLFDRDITSTFDAMEKEGTLNDFMLGLKPLMKPEDIPFEPHCYITSRRVPSEISAKWLDMHNFPTAPVYTVKPGTSKVEAAKQSGIDVFVDDNIKNFIELNNNRILCYLYDQPHNHRYNVGYKRIYNLKELL